MALPNGMRPGVIQGHTDIALSESGYALMAARALPFAFPRVYTSPMLRTRQTAQALGLADPVLDARLKEQNWGAWEGLTRAQILARDGEDAFVKAALSGAKPSGRAAENPTGELHARVAAFLKDAAHQEGRRRGCGASGRTARGLHARHPAGAWRRPCPADLDVSKILLLSLDAAGKPEIEALNLEFIARTARPS